MLKIFTVAFFGHRHIKNIAQTEKILEEQILKLIDENEYVDFLVGRNGDFDTVASSSVKRIQEKYGKKNSSLILVLPYKTSEFVNSKMYLEQFYNEIEICDKALDAFPKRAIQLRNRDMVDRADLIICNIDHNYGGAFQTIKYALKQEKSVINIATESSFLSKIK